MTKLTLLTALAICALAVQQASACDWNHEANSTPIVLAATTGEQAPKTEPVVPQVATEEPASTAPVTGATSHN